MQIFKLQMRLVAWEPPFPNPVALNPHCCRWQCINPDNHTPSLPCSERWSRRQKQKSLAGNSSKTLFVPGPSFPFSCLEQRGDGWSSCSHLRPQGGLER